MDVANLERLVRVFQDVSLGFPQAEDREWGIQTPPLKRQHSFHIPCRAHS